MPTKVRLVKAMVFPIVMYGCESWTVKKAEWWRIDAFELWCWRRLLRVSWTAGRSNQSILEEIRPGCSLEGLMLKLKETPILWPPDAKSCLTWKDPDAGKDWEQEEKGTSEDEMVEQHHQLVGCGFGWTLGVGDGQGGLACCGSWGRKESDTTERLNWTSSILITCSWCCNSLNLLLERPYFFLKGFHHSGKLSPLPRKPWPEPPEFDSVANKTIFLWSRYSFLLQVIFSFLI